MPLEEETSSSVPVLTIPHNLNALISDKTLFMIKKHDTATTAGIIQGHVFGVSSALWVKRFNYRGPFHFFVKWIFGSRAKRLYTISGLLYRKGLPVPKPLSYIEPSFREKNSFFISTVVEHASSLGEFYKKGLLQNTKKTVQRLAKAIAGWHLSGAVHGDLKWPNILVKVRHAPGEIFFVDLDQARLYRNPSVKGIRVDLSRFYRFGLELGAEEWVDTEFFPSYLSQLPDTLSSRLDWASIKRTAFEKWVQKGQKRY